MMYNKIIFFAFLLIGLISVNSAYANGCNENSFCITDMPGFEYIEYDEFLGGDGTLVSPFISNYKEQDIFLGCDEKVDSAFREFYLGGHKCN